MRDDLMVQQQVKSIWQHMVGVICLNKTRREKVKKEAKKDRKIDRQSEKD